MARRIVPIEGSAVRPLPHSELIGASHPGEPVEVDVWLRYPEDAPPLDDHEALAKRARASGRHPSSAEFLESHGAHPDDVSAIETFAGQHGLSVTGVEPAHQTVTLRGTVEAVSLAFGVHLADYDHQHGRHRAHSGPVHVPEEISHIVRGVLGLDTRPVVTPRRPAAQAASQKKRSSSYRPQEVAAAYDFPANLDGSGTSVGIIELGGGFRPQTLINYFKKVVGEVPKVVSIPVGSGFNNPTDLASSSEVYLDIEVLGAIVPGAAQNVYFAPPTNAGFVKAVKTAVHDARDNAVISISWGGSEIPSGGGPGQQAAMEDALQQAANLGIPVCAAAGDNGSSNQRPPNSSDLWAHVNYPASSPYALGCGGTRLDIRSGARRREVVWNDQNRYSATGGGVSAVFAAPSFQSGLSIPPTVNPAGVLGPVPGSPRGVPDVAGNADPQTGYFIVTDQSPAGTVVGGTSAVAPLWAALLAMITQQAGRRIGYLNPTLYRLGAGGRYFQDVTSGDNDTAEVGGYSAAAGWDACTGLGSPKGKALMQALLRQRPKTKRAARRSPRRRS